MRASIQITHVGANHFHQAFLLGVRQIAATVWIIRQGKLHFVTRAPSVGEAASRQRCPHREVGPRNIAPAQTEMCEPIRELPRPDLSYGFQWKSAATDVSEDFFFGFFP